MANGGYTNKLSERWVSKGTADKTSGVSAVVRDWLFRGIPTARTYTLGCLEGPVNPPVKFGLVFTPEGPFLSLIHI